MPDPKLVPPKLPEPIQTAAPYAERLKHALVALITYEQYRDRYQQIATQFHEHDLERRQKQRMLQKLAKQEAALTARVKRRLVKEHSARLNNPLGPVGETRDQLAERLLNERYARESTERVPTPQPRSRFNIRSLSPRAVLQSLRASKQLRSEHGFAALRHVQRTAADIRIRTITLNAESAVERANTRSAFDAAIKEFEGIAAAVKVAEQHRKEMSNGIRLDLRKLQKFVAAARKQIDAGRARFDAHGIRQQDQPSLRQHHQRGIQSDGAAPERPSRRLNQATTPPDTLTPQQRADHPLLAQYGLTSPPRASSQTVTRDRPRSR